MNRTARRAIARRRAKVAARKRLAADSHVPNYDIDRRSNHSKEDQEAMDVTLAHWQTVTPAEEQALASGPLPCNHPDGMICQLCESSTCCRRQRRRRPI